MAGAHNRLRAREMLKLAQLLIAGQSEKPDAWLKKQKQLIEEIEHRNV